MHETLNAVENQRTSGVFREEHHALHTQDFFAGGLGQYLQKGRDGVKGNRPLGLQRKGPNAVRAMLVTMTLVMGVMMTRVIMMAVSFMNAASAVVRVRRIFEARRSLVFRPPSVRLSGTARLAEPGAGFRRPRIGATTV